MKSRCIEKVTTPIIINQSNNNKGDQFEQNRTEQSRTEQDRVEQNTLYKKYEESVKCNSWMITVQTNILDGRA